MFYACIIHVVKNKVEVKVGGNIFYKNFCLYKQKKIKINFYNVFLRENYLNVHETY